jgi:hypothetical protein
VVAQNDCGAGAEEDGVLAAKTATPSGEEGAGAKETTRDCVATRATIAPPAIANPIANKKTTTHFFITSIITARRHRKQRTQYRRYREQRINKPMTCLKKYATLFSHRTMAFIKQVLTAFLIAL